MVSLRQLDRQISLEVVPPFGPGIRVNPPGSFVTIGGEPLIPQLEISFEIRKTITPEPNTGRVQVRNLGKISRDRIAGVIRRTVDISKEFAFIDGRLVTGSEVALGGLAQSVSKSLGIAYVRLEAGYNGARSQLWVGNGDRVTSRRERVNWITELTGSDGKLGATQGVANRTFAAGTPAVTIADYLRTVMGFGVGTPLIPGNPLLPPALSSYIFARPYTSAGPAYDELTALLTLISAAEQENRGNIFPRAFEWFVNDGDLFVLGAGATLPLPPIRVSPIPDPTALRLLSTPRRIENNGLEIQTLLAPTMIPGREVAVISAEAAGRYRCEEVAYTGINRGGGPFFNVARLRNLDPLAFL